MTRLKYDTYDTIMKSLFLIWSVSLTVVIVSTAVYIVHALVVAL